MNQPKAYYNENDPFAAEWLRNLITAEHIASGYVDERDIRDVAADDLDGFTQCHFFAGIGVWSHALRQAGWPDDRPVWTGSCPCQPFSGAGKRSGFDDERHLWPVWAKLIRQRRPGVILGEQVASKDGLAWWDAVQTDLEDADYAAGAVDLCAPGFGASHIRQRLYWMANSNGEDQGRRRIRRSGEGNRAGDGAACERSPVLCAIGGPGNTKSCNGGLPDGPHRKQMPEFTGADEARGLDIAAGERHRQDCVESVTGRRECSTRPTDGAPAFEQSAASPTNGYWRAADWLFCRDGKWRPVEPGTFPLVDRTSCRVGRLRAYGNAIVAPQAIEFISAVREIVDGG